MKAVVYTRYGPPEILAIREVAKPSQIQMLGAEFAGIVESVGKAVIGFAVDDAVFGAPGFRFGAHAEYVCVPEKRLASKPVNMTFEEAAAVLFGGVSALHFLRKAKVHTGQKVLVYGASGSVGIFAVQLAKNLGAQVTGVCSTALKGLIDAGKLRTVIDKRYSLDEIAEAHRHAEAGHNKGHVVMLLS